MFHSLKYQIYHTIFFYTKLNINNKNERNYDANTPTYFSKENHTVQ